MAHVQRFAGIPMSKALRGLCKEEDYAFLGDMETGQRQMEDAGREVERDWQKKQERTRRITERKQQEQERLRQLEEAREEKQQQWREHVALLAAERESTMRGRAARLRDFRDFQRKVIEEELGMEVETETGQRKVNELLARM